jgi:hypothetical protein
MQNAKNGKAGSTHQVISGLMSTQLSYAIPALVHMPPDIDVFQPP